MVTLGDVVGALEERFPANYLGFADGAFGFDCLGEHAGNCSWAALRLDSGDVLNASLRVSGAAQITLAARGAPAGSRVVEASYAWGAVPMMSLYDAATGLPVLPWKEAVP